MWAPQRQVLLLVSGVEEVGQVFARRPVVVPVPVLGVWTVEAQGLLQVVSILAVSVPVSCVDC